VGIVSTAELDWWYGLPINAAVELHPGAVAVVEQAEAQARHGTTCGHDADETWLCPEHQSLGLLCGPCLVAHDKTGGHHRNHAHPCARCLESYGVVIVPWTRPGSGTVSVETVVLCQDCGDDLSRRYQ